MITDKQAIEALKTIRTLCEEKGEQAEICSTCPIELWCLFERENVPINWDIKAGGQKKTFHEESKE